MRDKKKKHLIIRILVGTLNKFLFFPEYSKLNKNLKYAYNSFNTPYFTTQLKRNKLLMNIARIPFICTVGFVSLSLFRLPIQDIFNLNTRFGLLFTNPGLIIKKLSQEQELFLQYMFEISLFLSLVTIIMSYILRKKNNLLIDNIRFSKRFTKESEEDEGTKEEQIFLNTPAGVVFYLGDRSVKDLKEDKKLWESIKMIPGEYKEDPFNSKIVYFEKGFGLADKYIY